MSVVKHDPITAIAVDRLLLTSSGGGLQQIFLPEQKPYFYLARCLSVSAVWMTASYLWTTLMCGRWHTAKLWRPLRRQVLSSASMFSAENRLQRKSLKSNSSKGLKVSAEGCNASTFLRGLNNPLYPAKLCPLDFANLLSVNLTSFAHCLPASPLPFLRIRFQHCWRCGKPAHTRR